MKHFYFVCFCFVSLLSCKQNKKTIINATATDTVKVFPVNDFILNDINDVEKTAYYIYQITTAANKKRDSSKLTVQEFKTTANAFLEKNINVYGLKNQYKESVFNDLSTNSYTIVYKTVNEQLPVKDVTILLDNGNNKLKRIFITCEFEKNDSTFTEKYYWKAGKSFQINKLITAKNKKATEEQKKVVWNDTKE
jgi:hypothetical protein